MTAMRILAAALTGVFITGCSVPAGPAPTPAAAPATAQTLPADEMVFTVTATGGMVPPVHDAMDSPSLAIYGDGRVLTKVGNPGISLVPASYELSHVDPTKVAALVSGARSGGLFEPGTDFGQPRITDLPVTTVTLGGTGDRVRAGAYAIDDQFDEGLPDEQRKARTELRRLMTRAGDLAAGLPHTAYSPDRIVVFELDPRYAGSPATADWPGPPLSSFLHPGGKPGSIACGELWADRAEVVYHAALTNSGGAWLVDGETRVLAVNTLPMPDSCP